MLHISQVELQTQNIVLFFCEQMLLADGELKKFSNKQLIVFFLNFQFTIKYNLPCNGGQNKKDKFCILSDKFLRF